MIYYSWCSKTDFHKLKKNLPTTEHVYWSYWPNIESMMIKFATCINAYEKVNAKICFIKIDIVHDITISASLLDDNDIIFKKIKKLTTLL